MKALTRAATRGRVDGIVQVYLTQSGDKVVWQKSVPTQIRQLILCISTSKAQVDVFKGELTHAKRTYKNFV